MFKPQILNITFKDMKTEIYNRLINTIDSFLNKYGSGSICLGNLTKKELTKLQNKYSTHTIIKDYFGYWNFLKK